MYEGVAASLATTTEAHLMVSKLKEAKLLLTGKAGVDVVQMLGDKIDRDTREGLIADQAESKQDWQSYLDGLINYLTRLPVLTLTLAIKPSDDLLARINQELSKVTGGQSLIDIKYESGVLGGAKMEFNGKYLDLSLDKRMSEFITKEMVTKWMQAVYEQT